MPGGGRWKGRQKGGRFCPKGRLLSSWPQGSTKIRLQPKDVSLEPLPAEAAKRLFTREVQLLTFCLRVFPSVCSTDFCNRSRSRMPPPFSCLPFGLCFCAVDVRSARALG